MPGEPWARASPDSRCSAAFLAAGLLRTAGKALSIAAPLLFFVIAAPVLIRRPVWRPGRIAALLFVGGHILTGLLRPVLVGGTGGTLMPALPGSTPLLTLQKAGMDWRMDRLAAELKGCDRLIVDVRQPFMSEAVQLVATDLALPWGSTQSLRMPSINGERIRAPYQPPGWQRADCIPLTAAPIWSRAARSSGWSRTRGVSVLGREVRHAGDWCRRPSRRDGAGGLSYRRD